ncbi:hypothetical protein EJ04DRAFT_582559 [Polyplosphaeria fusca]|uniref:Uncharacterized protein n=1 Tax=Polyplosphaeria fusca TaxID=682080 RepID=A0A9P4QKL1_9PLEO|nr:hypothetical protein EJ04DRAFT_582559 [Polyplosphaeria fusca]
MDDVSTPSNQITKPPKRPLSLQKVKSATHGLLSNSPITSKWPWRGKNSPVSPYPASAPAGLTSETSTTKYLADHLKTTSRVDTEPSGLGSGLMTPGSSSLDEKALESAEAASASTGTTSGPPPSASTGSSKSAIPNEDTLSFAEIDLTVAVDCSGSTRGRVLEAEKKAIRSISDVLSPQARQRVVILPWNDEADSMLTLDELEDLVGNGGTDPTTLLRDRHHRQALTNSSLWVLLTDGCIDQFLIERFALDIGTHGLHGTAAIVICAGQIRSLTVQCNISVGKSVFAVVPDCMFLFHDVDMDKVYILQCKGRFKNLLPNAKQHISLNERTTWAELPQFPYDALRNFHVPKPRELSRDTVLLTSGKTFDLNQVYNDTLDPSITNEILSNDDDLKTLLLTATTRGRNEDIRQWISKKKLQTSDPIWKPRPDLGQIASGTTQKLVDAIRNSDHHNIPSLKKHLQSAHETNWQKFARSISVERENARIRDVVILDATARLDLEDSPQMSPCAPALSPVSPALSKRRSVGAEQAQRMFDPDDSPDLSDSDTEPVLPLPSRKPISLVSRHHFQRAPDRNDVGVIYTRGYTCRKFDRRPQLMSKYFEGNCNLCLRSGQIMALILSKPKDDEATANFPSPHQHARHKFPFLLGNFSDVDIVSHETFCETCSEYLVRHGESPKSDRVLGALPLVQTNGREHELNLQSWTESLNKAFEGRFDDSITISVFLSVLYNTLSDLAEEDSNENTTTIRAVRWACKNLLRSIKVCRNTATVPLGESPGPSNESPSAPLEEIIPWLVRETPRGDTTLLSYPLDGFLILILSAKDIDHENCGRALLRCVIWLRLAYHMAEEHYNAIRDNKDSAISNLIQLLHFEDSEANPKGPDQKVLLKRSAVTLASLKGTPLLSSDDWETFGRMGTLFTQLTSRCEPATAVYLHYLLRCSSKYHSAMECFKAVRNVKALRKVFVSPEEVELSHAATIIAGLQAKTNK